MSKDEFILMLDEIRVSENTIGPLFGVGWMSAVDYITQRMKTELDVAPAPYPDTLELRVLYLILTNLMGGVERLSGEQTYKIITDLHARFDAENSPAPVEAKPHPDTERLDWIEDQRKRKGLWMTSSNGLFGSDGTEAVVSREEIKPDDDSEYEEWIGADIRAAIDAARKASEPGEEKKAC